MKIRFILTSILIVFVSSLGAQTLKFNKDKKFKIVQFTDIHFKHGNPASDIALERINQVLDAEKPDFVIYTGDLIYAKPAKEGLFAVLEPCSKRGIPFGVVWGNHDDEFGFNRKELVEMIKDIPGNLTSMVQGLSGATNFILPVKSSSNNKDASVLYCLDSHAYSSIEGVGGYDYIKSDQIEWYKENSKKYTAANNGEPLPSLAFFHIPLPEYNVAASSETAIFRGNRLERACSPALNSGMFVAMKESKDVMGMFVGHDHDNDYATNWNGILLAYGRYTGGNTVYNHLPNGARVIEMTEGERSFSSWIRLKDKVEQKYTFPTDFVKAKNNPQ